LGAFISTFADPLLTGLHLSNCGSIVYSPLSKHQSSDGVKWVTFSHVSKLQNCSCTVTEVSCDLWERLLELTYSERQTHYVPKETDSTVAVVKRQHLFNSLCSQDTLGKPMSEYQTILGFDAGGSGAKLHISPPPWHQSLVSTGQMPFRLPNQQCQSTEGKATVIKATIIPQTHIIHTQVYILGFFYLFLLLVLIIDYPLLVVPRAGSGVVRMDPLRFLAGCRTRRLNQG